MEYSLIQTSKRERKNSWKRNKYKNKAKTTRIQSNKKKVKNLEYSQIKRQKKLEYRQIKKTEKGWNTDKLKRQKKQPEYSQTKKTEKTAKIQS